MKDNIICSGDLLLAKKDPQRLAKKLAGIWESAQVNHRGNLAPNVRQPIGRSWQRCRGSGVSPHIEVAPQVLQFDEYQNRHNRFFSLLKTTNSIGALDSFCDLSTFILAIADKDGFLLELAGRPEILDDVARRNFVVGANWSETITGTNAIGTALLESRTTTVFSAEHFCQGWHGYACTATPVRHPFSGRTIGAVNITSKFIHFQPHVKLLVENIARLLEMEIQRKKEEEELVFHQNAMAAMMDKLSEGVVVVDEADNIRRVSIQRIGLDSLKGLECLSDKHCSLGDMPALRGIEDLPFVHGVEERVLESGLKVRISPIHSKGSYLGSVIFINPRARTAQTPMQPSSSSRCPMPVGRSGEIKDILQKAREIARFDCNLYIRGQTGTGKTLLARYVHSQSPRAEAPYAAVNCGSLPSQLIASELFGYEPGAFTGARRNGYAGKFEAVNGGTILLDEISELSLEAQAYLLQVLEEKQLTPLGSTKVRDIDVRVIAASNKSLRRAVGQGTFREDLYYRIKVVSLKLPALCQRPGDIEILAEHFLELLNKRMGKNIAGFSRRALEALLGYSWPGNIRELKNALEHAMIFCPEQGVVSLSALPDSIRAKEDFKVPRRPDLGSEDGRDMLVSAVKTSKGNISLIAKVLGVSRPTVYKWIKEYGLELPCPKESRQ